MIYDVNINTLHFSIFPRYFLEIVVLLFNAGKCGLDTFQQSGLIEDLLTGFVILLTLFF